MFYRIFLILSMNMRNIPYYIIIPDEYSHLGLHVGNIPHNIVGTT